MTREILHVNICHFMAAVAQALDPPLRGRPVIVAPPGVERARVLDLSREAYDEGVRRGMWLGDARRICRGASVVAPDRGPARKAMDAVLKELSGLSPLVEPAGAGHAFVDVTGTGRLLGPAIDVADRARSRIASGYCLPAGVGVSGSKLMSKVATRVVKPGGLCTVMRGEERQFLAQLPVRILPGLDAGVLDRLVKFNVSTVGQLAAIPVAQLEGPFGDLALPVHLRAIGEDSSPVTPSGSPPPSVGEETVFTPDTNDESEIERGLFAVAVRSGRRLRALGMAPGRARMAIAYADGARVTGQAAMHGRADLDLSLYGRLVALYAKTAGVSGGAKGGPGGVPRTRRVRVRKVSVFLDRMSYPGGQLELFEGPHTKEAELMHAIDSVHRRFGDKAVGWGRLALECGG
jgi:DNA polymerase-4